MLAIVSCSIDYGTNIWDSVCSHVVLHFSTIPYMMQLPVPSPTVFSALLSGDIQRLCSCSQDELRPFLPCLARMVLCSRSSPVPALKEVTASRSKSEWEGRRKVVHALIAGMGEVNTISKYLTVDFHVSCLLCVQA